MRESMKEALLQIYRNLDAAGLRQSERGIHDQGARRQVTSGKHMDAVASVIRADLLDSGYDRNSVYYENGCLTLPGWFRPSKNWDLLAFDGGDLLAAVELKSINSSFGNNANNRAEEAIGSATDIAHAIKNDLIPYRTVPPLLGFVLVVRLCDKSTQAAEKTHNSAVYPIDPAFDHVSYLQRLTILCRRLLAERIYQAVWIVGVDPENGVILEPEPDLTYEKFLAALRAQLLIHRA